jgi:hypothetical protein
LQQARRAGLQNLSEDRRFQIVLRQTQIGMVQQVEALGAELQTRPLGDREVFGNRKIHILNTGPRTTLRPLLPNWRPALSG